ncbi:hypothetical protein IG631_23536 [Alternaria alternata]|nr:hypothetical protein IG631_23536 [Alternaria alternata]
MLTEIISVSALIVISAVEPSAYSCRALSFLVRSGIQDTTYSAVRKTTTAPLIPLDGETLLYKTGTNSDLSSRTSVKVQDERQLCCTNQVRRRCGWEFLDDYWGTSGRTAPRSSARHPAPTKRLDDQGGMTQSAASFIVGLLIASLTRERLQYRETRFFPCYAMTLLLPIFDGAAVAQFPAFKTRNPELDHTLHRSASFL